MFWRFCLVGTVGFIADAGLLTILLALSSLGPIGARGLSFAAAVLITWRLNRRITFADRIDRTDRSWWGELARYVASSIAGLATNFAVYTALILGSATFAARPWLAVAAASVVALAVNFLAAKHWVFR